MIDGLEGATNISHLFIPDIPGGYESIAIAASALGATQRLRIGSGVIRLLEHDDTGLLLRRMETIQSASGNRFILGVGTGAPGPSPGKTIDAMLSKLEKIRSEFGRKTSDQEVAMPDTFVATLKPRIAKKAAEARVSGILLNFCSANYAHDMISRLREGGHLDIDCACYIKVFYSRDQSTADRLLIQEFVNYNSLSQYHLMFQMDGVASAIEQAGSSLKRDEGGAAPQIPQALRQISLSNPTINDLRELVAKFREAGVTLPCIYPYFSRDEEEGYKGEIIRSIAQARV